MSARTSAATDQITAQVRDLTPGQLVALIDSLAHGINSYTEGLAKRGNDDVGPIGALACLVGLAVSHLEKTHPKECVADELEVIKDALLGGMNQ